MAPRTVSGLAGGTAHDGHIHHKNYEFISTKGPASASARSYNPNLSHGDPGRVARSGHTLGTAFGGNISEFTYPEGLVPSSTTSSGQASRSGNQRSTARNKLTRGMASTGHILLGNHDVNHTKGQMPASVLSCDPDLRPVGLDPMVHGGHTLKTTLEGCIPECTHVRG
jgi:hypothetical protein